MTKRFESNEERNLDFIKEILKAKEMNMAEFAKAAGVSQQIVYHYLTLKDDMTLFTAQKLLQAININLCVSFESAAEEEEPQPITLTKKKYVIIGNAPAKKSAQTPKYIRDCIGSGKRMEFLARELAALQADEKTLCETFEIKRGALMYIFSNDNIYISVLYRFAEKLNKTIQWNITNTTEKTNALNYNQTVRKKVHDCLGNVRIVNIRHIKTNHFRCIIETEEKEITPQSSMKILSVNPNKHEVTLEVIL